MDILIFPVHNFMIKIKFHDKRKKFVDNQKEDGALGHP